MVAVSVLAVLWVPSCKREMDFDPTPMLLETGVLVQDIDGDGLSDIITIAQYVTSYSHGEGRVGIHRQISPGVFAARETYVVGVGPWDLAAGDLNGDGLPDLVVTDWDGRAVWLMVQDSHNKGHFLSAQWIAGGFIGNHVAVADLNGDGRLDVALDGDEDLVLLYQNPAAPGTFLAPVTLAVPGGAGRVAVGDLNGDGLADLAADVYLSDPPPAVEFVVFLQQPGNGFGPMTILAPEGHYNCNQLSVVDYDGDGRQDLIAYLTPSRAEQTPKITVFLQGAILGTFGAPVDTKVQSRAFGGLTSAAIADLDGDGRPDVALGASLKSKFALFLQAGGGTFARAATYTMGHPLGCATVGDVDGDGRNDLVGFGDDKVTVRFQSHTAPGTFEDLVPIP